MFCLKTKLSRAAKATIYNTGQQSVDNKKRSIFSVALELDRIGPSH